MRYYYEPREGDSPPAFKRSESWSIDSQDPGKSQLHIVMEIDEFRRSPVPFPDSDFTLSAFGLPEPMGIQPPRPPSHTWQWLLAAAVGLSALAILFAYLKRWRSASAPAITSAPENRGSS